VETAESAFNRANALHVEEDFAEAAKHYDTALELESKNPSYFLHRATNSLKLRRYADVVKDADACLKLDQKNHTAYLRKGVALFHQDKYADADAALRKASELGNKQTDLWTRKCSAELALQSKAQASKKTASVPSPSTSDESHTPSSGSSTPAATTPAVPVGPLSEKVRENWFQTRSAVTITLFARDLAADAVSVKLGDNAQNLNVIVKMPDGSIFSKTWNLFAPLRHAPTVTITPFKVEIILSKSADKDWDGLEAAAARPDVVKRDNLKADTGGAKVDPRQYPSSARGTHTDWGELETKVKKDEEEEKPEGDQALHKLFQKIYQGANEDTRRAMIKSYQTSGGTVLSTNWGEVAKKDYTQDRQAPKGQEFRDWPT